MEGVKACAPERKAIASAKREATMVELRTSMWACVDGAWTRAGER